MINYDLSRIRCIAFDVDGVLSRQTITLSAEGEPLRTVNIRDGYAIQLAMKMGLRIAIITGGKTQAVRKRYEGLGVEDICMGSAVKLTAYEDLLRRHGLKDDEVMFMGDDIPDYPMMKLAGVKCCPANAATEIQELADYISIRNGGDGAVRDVIEQTMRLQGTWFNEDAHIW